MDTLFISITQLPIIIFSSTLEVRLKVFRQTLLSRWLFMSVTWAVTSTPSVLLISTVSFRLKLKTTPKKK